MTYSVQSMIENYRPVANLCCVSKIFEKLILKRIQDLESISGITVGGNQQHGFAKSKSTVTAGLILQSLIARALDDDCYESATEPLIIIFPSLICTKCVTEQLLKCT